MKWQVEKNAAAEQFWAAASNLDVTLRTVAKRYKRRYYIR